MGQDGSPLPMNFSLICNLQSGICNQFDSRTRKISKEKSMDGSQVIETSREAIQLALWLGGPLLLVALVAGLLVGVGQTLTQMHEPVVGQVARLVAVLTVVVFALPWLVGRWVAYTSALIGSIPDRF